VTLTIYVKVKSFRAGCVKVNIYPNEYSEPNSRLVEDKLDYEISHAS